MDTMHTESVIYDSNKDTTHAATATNDSTIYGIDFGTGDACAVHGPFGPLSKRELKLPRRKPGEGKRTRAMEFPMILEALMQGSDEREPGDVVVESSTIGSSGCEPEDIIELLARYPSRKLYTISCHAVKNFRKDNALGWAKGARYAKDGDPVPVLIPIDSQTNVHTEDAEIIYRIGTEQPYRLHHWTEPTSGPERIHTSVRPMDKRDYRDERAERFMSLLPPFETLPTELQKLFYKKEDRGYSRAMVMPFAMASEEPYIHEGDRESRRKRYEKIIGLYDRGYPSFYRRATINWMQTIAKGLAKVTKIEEVPPPIRKQAWRITQRQIRQFFHLTMKHQGR